VLLWPLRGEDTARTILHRAYSRSNADGAIVCSARPPNSEGAKLRGQGPRAEADAARRLPAYESRDADGVTPSRWR